MAKTWMCGDCRAVWPKSRRYCGRPFDDYLALRGGSIEAAMERALRPYLLRLATVEAGQETRAWAPTAATSTFAIAA